MKKAIPTEEMQDLINATEENRARLHEAWEKIEDLQAAVNASQELQIQSQERLSGNKPKPRK